MNHQAIETINGVNYLVTRPYGRNKAVIRVILTYSKDARPRDIFGCIRPMRAAQSERAWSQMARVVHGH